MTAFRKFILTVSLLFTVFFSADAEILNNGPMASVGPERIIASEEGQILLANVQLASLWLSENGGNTWRCFDREIREVNDVPYDQIYPYMVNDSVFVFVAVSINPDIMEFDIIVTFDRCETFLDRSPQSWPYNIKYDSFTIHSNDEFTWMIQTDDLIYHTENAGLDWSAAPCVQNVGHYRNMFGVYRDIVDPDTYYNLTAFYFSYETGERCSQIYRTTDSSESWELDTPFIDTTVDLANSHLAIGDFLPLSNGEFLAIVSSNDPEDIYWDTDPVVTFDVNGDFALRSGGNTGISKLYFEDFSIPGRIYAKIRYETDIYVSNDFGLTWNAMECNGLPDFDYYHFNTFMQAKNDTTLYLSVEDTGLFKSEDHGTNWEQISTFEWARFIGVYPSSDNLFYKESSSNWYYQSDPGETLYSMSIPSPDSLSKHYDIYYANGDTLVGAVNIFPGNDHRLYRTFDFGQTWEMIADLSQFSVRYFHDPTEGVFYLLSKSDEELSISRDFGNTWDLLPYPFEEIGGLNIQVSCYYDNRFYITNLDSSTHTSRVWELDIETSELIDTNYPDNTHGGPNLLAVPDGVYGFGFNREVYSYSNDQWELIGTTPAEFGIFFTANLIYNDPLAFVGIGWLSPKMIFSQDGGYTWRIVEFVAPEGLPLATVNGFKQDLDRNRIWIETNLGLFWYNLEDFLDAEEGKLELNPVDFNLLTAYPNPFNASTRIQYHLEKPGNVKLDVYDITGRLVKTLENTHQPAGRQNVFFDGSALASGTYFIQLKTGTETRYRRISLVK